MISHDSVSDNWLATMRLDALRERGWNGTFAEWQSAYSRLRADPLSAGQTEPTDEDREAAKRRG